MATRKPCGISPRDRPRVNCYDDSGAYTKPFTLYGHHTYEADTELMEYICNENNRDVEHIVGKDPRNKYSKK